jgi:hypothetical protein
MPRHKHIGGTGPIDALTMVELNKKAAQIRQNPWSYEPKRNRFHPNDFEYLNDIRNDEIENLRNPGREVFENDVNISPIPQVENRPYSLATTEEQSITAFAPRNLAANGDYETSDVESRPEWAMTDEGSMLSSSDEDSDFFTRRNSYNDDETLGGVGGRMKKKYKKSYRSSSRKWKRKSIKKKKRMRKNNKRTRK